MEQTKSGLLAVTKKQTLEEAFPVVDAGATPLGGRILVQLRCAKTMSDGGIALADESKDYEKWNTAVGKVIALGPLAFKDRNTAEYWPEGAWVTEGEYVRVPKWGGDRWEIPVPEDKDLPYGLQRKARFVIYNDREVISKITGNPLDFVDYV